MFLDFRLYGATNVLRTCYRLTSAIIRSVSGVTFDTNHDDREVRVGWYSLSLYFPSSSLMRRSIASFKPSAFASSLNPACIDALTTAAVLRSRSIHAICHASLQSTSLTHQISRQNWRHSVYNREKRFTQRRNHATVGNTIASTLSHRRTISV